jgi:hypothetical protein
MSRQPKQTNKFNPKLTQHQLNNLKKKSRNQHKKAKRKKNKIFLENY